MMWKYCGGIALAVLMLTPGIAIAGIAKIKGLHDDHERIEPLIKAPVTQLEKPGRIFSVIGGDYGFDLLNPSGSRVAAFDDSQDALGYEIKPGDYKVVPRIEDDGHHHQFIEVLIKTD